MQVYIDDELVTLTPEDAALWQAAASAALLPDKITRTQGLLALLERDPPITEAQILAFIATIEPEIERERVRILFANPDWRPNDPLWSQHCATFGLTSADVGDLFRHAATL